MKQLSVGHRCNFCGQEIVSLLPVRVEFQFRQQLESEIGRCNVASRYMIQV